MNLQKKIIQLKEEIEQYEEVNDDNNLIEASTGQSEIYKNKLKTKMIRI